ncbi:glycosyltransferase [Vagococcus jeotgali]|uniref:glycosyltransferase n=1 Tax=Vagococcus jeotgali TaxID=3109030 RepID=UPI002DDAE22D|nr:glycosyltransferase [Vagococcus sp. B2T-5]
MKILFCHDGPLREEAGAYYGVSHTDEVFERYINTPSDTLEVLIRTTPFRDTDKISNFSKLSLNNLKVTPTPDVFKDINKSNERSKIIENSVRSSDLIIVRLPSFIGLSAIKMAKKYNKKYMVEFVADPWHSFWNHSYKGKVMAPLVTLLNKKAVKEAPYVLYVTNEYLQKNYPTTGFSIGCSDVLLNDTEPNFDRYKKRNKKKKIIGTLAAINVKFKGQDCVIKALGYLKKQGNTEFIYQLVGGGSNEYLKQIAKENNVEDQVVFLGALPHNKVFEWLSTLDIYIQPSKQEGLPRAVVEAMSTGAFCLGSKTGGIPELLEEKYIFSNKKSNYKEIATLLGSFNTDEAFKSGKINYEKSLLFQKNKLESKRQNFYIDFIENL